MDTLSDMVTRIVVSLNAAERAALYSELAHNGAPHRSDAVQRRIARLERARRYRSEEAVLTALAARAEAVYPDLDGLRTLPCADVD